MSMPTASLREWLGPPVLQPFLHDDDVRTTGEQP
jgi:hypothetical protein